MANTNILPQNWHYQRIKGLIYDVTASNSYYLYVADHLPHSNVTLQPISDDLNDVYLEPYDQMIMGKRIKNADVIPVIQNFPWSSTIFTMYDDQDINLINERFYCIVNEGSYYHIWKCLDNNLGANSTVQPSFAAGSGTLLYQTSDGYRWKYMTSVSSSTVGKFGTANVFPLVANTALSNTSVNGRIDVIAIQSNQQGRGYNNYIDGSFKSADIRVNGDPTLFNLSNTAVNTVNGYYTGCILYLTTGVGQGEYITVADFICNSTGNLIKTNGQFPIFPQNGDNYQIRPQVQVIGDGTQSVNCVARASINALNGNSVYRVEVLQFGADYVEATANILANAVVGLDDDNLAVIRPIIGPYGGHGYDCFNELFCRNVEFSVTLANTENNTLPTTNFYQQIGILRNPLFQNVQLTFLSSYGNFTLGEQIYIIRPVQLNVNCTSNTANVTISCNNAAFSTQVSPKDYLIISNRETTLYQLVQVNSITNSSSINVSSNVLFSCTNVILSAVNTSSNCICSSITNNSVIIVTNCPPLINTGSLVIGGQSGAFGMVNTIQRNGVTKQFDTFIQLHKYIGTMISGAFINNEAVHQGNNVGYVHHVEGSTNITLYLSEMNVIFAANSTPIIGNTSGAQATLTSQYPQEVIFGSGAVEYIENITPVIRQNTQSETWQIVVEF